MEEEEEERAALVGVNNARSTEEVSSVHQEDDNDDEEERMVVGVALSFLFCLGGPPWSRVTSRAPSVEIVKSVLSCPVLSCPALPCPAAGARVLGLPWSCSVVSRAARTRIRSSSTKQQEAATKQARTKHHKLLLFLPWQGHPLACVPHCAWSLLLVRFLQRDTDSEPNLIMTSPLI